ncbi:MAG: hypothetical protein JW969_03885 [Spirochaetales bacterium]|nr:hypothetical protein [Spirochaetales bacterium]
MKIKIGKVFIVIVISASLFVLSGCILTPTQFLHLSLPSSFFENDYTSHTATVYIMSAAEYDLLIDLSVDSAGLGRIYVPAYVVIPEGSTYVSFEIEPIDDVLVNEDVTVTITASHPDYESASDTVTVRNDDEIE